MPQAVTRYSMSSRYLSLVLCVAGLSVQTAGAETIAAWTFETNAPTSAGPYTADFGRLAGSSFATSNTGGSYPLTLGSGSPTSYTTDNWNTGDFFQFEVRTDQSGYKNVQVSFDVRSAAGGPTSFSLQYSGLRQPFTQAATYSVGTDWTTVTYDFSTIPSLVSDEDGLNIFAFRLVNTSPAGGFSSVDNFIVSASPIPEPSNALIGAVLGVALLRRKRDRA